MDPEDIFEPDDGGPPYADMASIDPGGLAQALGRLALFDDPFLRMQATNLGMVDVFLNQLEDQLVRALVEEDGTPLSTAFVAAQSQMWIFAAYELLRTWKQRAKDTMKLIVAGRVEARLAELEKDLGYRHGAREPASTDRRHAGCPGGSRRGSPPYPCHLRTDEHAADVVGQARDRGRAGLGGLRAGLRPHQSLVRRHRLRAVLGRRGLRHRQSPRFRRWTARNVAAGTADGPGVGRVRPGFEGSTQDVSILIRMATGGAVGGG
jgi:hypothetical protein